MSDTIAALATGRTAAAIGIVRISGDGAVPAAAAVFSPRNGRPLEQAENHKMILGSLRSRGGMVIDQALAVVSRGPGSYTGEDCVEFHCHGSPVVLAECLEALFERGVRQARAGEFTQRAFLNGRMDLVQAEAVADLMEAETAEAAANAAGQLAGAVSGRVNGVYETLLDMAAHVQAVVDYPDEELVPVEVEKMKEQLDHSSLVLRRLLQSGRRGRILRYGIPCVLLGRPNTGKSSLLNAILGYDRAIVTPFAGTTRDTVVERVKLGGILLRLADTAGIRESEDPVERLGVERTRSAAREAELALLVLEGSEPLAKDDWEAMDQAAAAKYSVAVINKSDLPAKLEKGEIQRRFTRVCEVSALTGEGLGQLEDIVRQLFADRTPCETGEILTNARQGEAVSRALKSLESALKALRGGLTPDTVLMDVEEGLAALGELTGRTVQSDMVDRIFERFCVGK